MKKYLKTITITLILINSTLTVYADGSFSNLKDVQTDIYRHLQNRDTTISFTYKGTMKEFKNNISKTIVDAYSSDDYTERSWIEIKPTAKSSKEGIENKIEVTYLTTKKQEEYIENELKKATTLVIKQGMSDLDKVKAINDYIISRYDYDYTLISSNPYSALTTGVTVCQGYSMTAYKMLNYAGIQNRIVVGTNKGASHSWNIVKIGENWYHMDTTNNDSTRSSKYFLISDSILESNQYLWDKLKYPRALTSYYK